MGHSNKLVKIYGILARYLQASISRNREDIRNEPTLHYRNLAHDLVSIVSSLDTDPYMWKGALNGLAPMWEQGRWVTRGRLGQGLFRVLGVSKLDLLVPGSRLAELKMMEAHKQDHKGPKITLWRSQREVWIWRGMRLAEKVEKNCV